MSTLISDFIFWATITKNQWAPSVQWDSKIQQRCGFSWYATCTCTCYSWFSHSAGSNRQSLYGELYESCSKSSENMRQSVQPHPEPHLPNPKETWGSQICRLVNWKKLIETSNTLGYLQISDSLGLNVTTL